MGCFLGCFGFSSKRKRRKPANRLQPRHQRICSYEPLDSASANLDVSGDPVNLESELNADSKKSKQPFNHKIRKKVSFNLNVQTYQPIPKEEGSDHFWGSDDEENKQGSSKEATKERKSSTAAEMVSYPSNYRYRNCIDSYDEEDDIAYEESDFDDEDEDDPEEEYDDDIGCLRISQEEEVSEKFESLTVNRDSLTEQRCESLSEEGMKFAVTNRNARDRNQYIHSVLNPVENLSQWKALKAKAMPPVKRQRKENVPSQQQTQIPSSSSDSMSKSTPVSSEIAVDASLSNWLGSAESCQLKSSISSVENISSFD